MPTKSSKLIGLSRRQILKAGAAGASWAAMAPGIIGSARAADENVLYVNTWGGIWTQNERKYFYEPFTAATGIAVRTVEPVSLSKLKAQVQSGSYEFDVTSLSSMEFHQAADENLVEPLDFSVLDKSKLWPGATVRDRGLQGVSLGTILIYNKKKFPNGGPKSWADFWDVKKFPGARSLQNEPSRALAFALLADGVPMDKLYPLDIDRAFKKLNEIKPHIKVWWTQGAQSEQLMKDGEVDMMSIWNSRTRPILDAGIQLELVWNQMQVDLGPWCVTRGTPRKKAAFQFLNFAIDAKHQADFCNAMYYGPSNPAANALMKPEVVELSPTSPEHLKLGFATDSQWLSPLFPKIKERWQEWLTS